MPAVLFHLSDWTQIEFTGRDRQNFLHGFCTNDIKRLGPGEGCEAFLPNIKGRILGQIHVFAEEDRLCLQSVPGQGPAILSHLDRYLIAEDVQMFDRTTEWGLLLLTGNEVDSLLVQAQWTEQPPTALWQHQQILKRISKGSLRRCDMTPDPGWTISVPASALAEVMSLLTAAGATVGTAIEFESLRIEHGYPLFGVDLSEDNLVHESSRVPQTVSFTKGCYLGQEPIARLDALGHVNRQLVRLRMAGESAAPTGSLVWSESTDTARPAGHVTSSAVRCTHVDVVALALLRRELTAVGTLLQVEVSPGNRVTAEVW